MAQRGFTYEPKQYVDDADRRAATLDYQVGDLDVAAAVGYGIAEHADVGATVAQADANVSRIQDMAPAQRAAWFEALHGKDRPPPDREHPSSDPDVGFVSIPSGPAMSWDRNSCLTRALRELYGADDDYKRALLETNMAFNEVYRLVDADPEQVAGVARWRQCMIGRGHDYPAPGEAAAELGRALHEGRISRDDLRSREIAIATADAECFASTGLGELRAALQQRFEREVQARYAEALASYERMVQRALREAHRSPAAAGSADQTPASDGASRS
jgi:hypothetical protein